MVNDRSIGSRMGIAAVALALLAGVAASLTACGSSEGTATAGTSSSASEQAWAMGTKVTFTNDTSESLELSYWSKKNYAALAPGSSVSETDDYEVMTTTWIPEYLKYANGDEIKIEVHNPSFDYPYFNTTDTGGTKSDNTDMKEGDTKTVEVSGHKLTFSRLTDDDSLTGNKNWTVKIES